MFSSREVPPRPSLALDNEFIHGNKVYRLNKVHDMVGLCCGAACELLVRGLRLLCEDT